MVQLEDSLPETLVFLKSEAVLPVPFAEQKLAYSPKSFTGAVHLLTARPAQPWEISQYRNLALNPFDCHRNTGMYPHADANVETRNESVFAARNAINGNLANTCHGNYPFESWGINRQADAALCLTLGQSACVDRAVITLRADFPHDNWWKTVQLEFSDGSCETLTLQKTKAPQAFALAPRSAVWVRLSHLQKDESDPSPFPALTQLALWGSYRP